DGQDRYTTEIVANEMHMLGSRSGGTANYSDNQGAYSSQSPASSQSKPQQSTPPTSAPPPYDDFDDDIPF
ncbi:MAG TPA: single-stranded DNA-binding protein, partial [Methylococcaceae bacterium]|nr:single-stranded DNA-binding protein [Methylococcaceae bacterium]